MSALSLLIRNAGFAPASHVRVELFLPGSVISECCDYPAPSESFANEVLSSDRNFFDDLFCIDKSPSYEQYADTAARGESAFRPNLIKDNVTSVHGMWPSYDSGDFRADMEELLSGFEFVKNKQWQSRCEGVFRPRSAWRGFCVPVSSSVRWRMRSAAL